MTRFRRELQIAEQRLAGRDKRKLDSGEFGTIEFGQYGQGPDLLVCHALYGGFDIGLGIGATYAGDGYRVLAPSRFGYLGSALPEGASPAVQADAYAALLDALGVKRTVVFGYSAGGVSAVQFALRHPEHTQALILLASAESFLPVRPRKAGVLFDLYGRPADTSYLVASSACETRSAQSLRDPQRRHSAPLSRYEAA